MDQSHAPSSLRMARYLLVLLGLTLGLAACSEIPGLAGQPTTPPVVIIVTATPAPGGSVPAPATPAPTEVPAPDAPTPDPNVPPPTAEPTASPAQVSVLQRVRERGRLICGTNADLPGFGFYDAVRANWTGFDVDFCRAVAVAVLGPNAEVEFIGLNTSGRNERFEAIRSGSVDVLFRNTTWTLGRDIAQLAFGPTTFHDGQTFMVRTNARIATSADLAGKRICVSRGTTSEQNLNDDFGARGIAFEAVLFDDENLLYPAYDRGECDAVTSDSSQLASKRQTLRNPNEHVVLGERISREPLGPAFIEGDEQWRDVVSWVVFATMYAEELRVTRANVESERATSTDPRVRRLLGLEGNLGEGLGLSNDFAYHVISVVGNYGDIYDRNLGPSTPFALDRGPNKAWNLGAGGVLASPPFR
ncbi:MAG: amino acid ABC transporter substrate-binding protein [Oscillochloridaceae bacterium umkhey_bin13]